ncbi:MAG: M20/M25/M40 family metallo-hydrolase [Sphaerochaetaceae bacterium]|nr:M20/M25/M40 family metallo-hydrolase [Sphaerochaetaceae bacterium]
MNKKQKIKMIENLSNSFGISGFEVDVIALIRDLSKDLGTCEEDSMRNLYLKRDDHTEKLLTVSLNCHTDEVGFMVQFIKDDGTLTLIPIGGWVATNPVSQLVMVRNRDGEYKKGIVVSKPPHFMSAEERAKSITVDDLTVDLGVTSKKEVVDDFKIDIGAPVVPYAKFEFDEQHDIMLGKAFDDRIGCASVLMAFDELKDESLNVNIVGDFTSQEEVGCRGSVLAANTTKPDLCISFEGCPSDDTVVEPYKRQTVLKRGPMLRYIDSGMITNPRFQAFAIECAREFDIPFQTAVRSGGYTNGKSYQLTNNGVPTVIIGIPTRYAHSHYGYCCYSDVENAVKLGASMIKKLNRATIKSF